MRPDFMRLSGATVDRNRAGKCGPAWALAVLLFGLVAATANPALAQGQMRQTEGPSSAASETAEPAGSTEAEDESQADEQDDDEAADNKEAAETDGGPPSTGGPDNQLDPDDRIVPSIVREQRQQYQALEKVWGQRRVPSGLAGDIGAARPSNSGVSSVALEARNVDFYLDGRLKLDDPAPIAEWQSPGDPRRNITLRHLLHMASGLDHTEGLDPDQPGEIYDGDTARMLFLDGADPGDVPAGQRQDPRRDAAPYISAFTP